MTRIAARHKHRVNPWQLFENFAPFLERKLHRLRVRIIQVHGRIPDPDLQTELVRHPRHGDHHLHRRERKVGAGRIVVRARRNQLDGIAAKHHEIAKVLLPALDVPRIVRIGLGSVTELVSAQPVSRSRRDAQLVRQTDGARFHPQTAQQMSDAEQHAARVVADDHYCRRAWALLDPDPITFRPLDLPFSGKRFRVFSGKRIQLRLLPDSNDRRC